MTDQEMKDLFEATRSRYLLGKFNHAFQSNEFVQVVLDVISEEADIIGKLDSEEDVFDQNSKDPICYVKFTYFERFLEDAGYTDIDEWTYEEEIATLTDFMKDKLVIIKPYYYYNDYRGVFFKNGTIADIVDATVSYADSFFTIPVIPNVDSYEKFMRNEQFPMPSISKHIMGTPDYLYFDKKIYKATLSALETNDVYWKNSDELNSKFELNIDVDKMVDDGDLIVTPDNTYIFAKRAAIINTKAKAKKIVEEVSKQVGEESLDTTYDDSDVTKELNKFIEYTKNANLCYSKNDIYNFYTCVCASQLIIIAGMSGTGKTKLPLKYAEYFNMTEDNNTLLFVPVSPSFNEPADVLGYLNPTNGLYVSSETRLVEFLKHAEDNPDKMHMILFDEMNLSQIEFWFAPFMSILEKDIKDRKISLYSESQRCINSEKYPSSIRIGRNIIFIGTINLDETTKNISDRLLDRAYIINLKKETFTNYQAQQLGKNATNIQPFEGDFMSYMPKEDESEYNYISKFNLKQLEFFDKVHSELNKIDTQKGISFRSVKNISLYLNHKPLELDDKLAFDYAFKQTVMKKINGSSDSIGAILGNLDENGEPSGLLINIFDEYSEVSEFKECRIEIKNKILELKKYGYAR